MTTHRLRCLGAAALGGLAAAAGTAVLQRRALRRRARAAPDAPVALAPVGDHALAPRDDGARPAVAPPLAPWEARLVRRVDAAALLAGTVVGLVRIRRPLAAVARAPRAWRWFAGGRG
ncbi:MAG TPA: hypothetical protein VGQ83_11815 [Polyangia bacterium]|jgi:hypothetical protein